MCTQRRRNRTEGQGPEVRGEVAPQSTNTHAMLFLGLPLSLGVGMRTRWIRLLKRSSLHDMSMSPMLTVISPVCAGTGVYSASVAPLPTSILVSNSEGRTHQVPQHPNLPPLPLIALCNVSNVPCASRPGRTSRPSPPVCWKSSVRTSKSACAPARIGGGPNVEVAFATPALSCA